jgi:hypothetical protein
MPVPCALCNMPLPKWGLAAGEAAVCMLCGASNQAYVYPAAFHAPAPVATEAALDGEAACFDHPAKRAVAACQQCGRFVCQLCAVELGDATWCPSCVAAGAGQAKAAKLDGSRILYDSVALMAPLVALLMWPFTIIAAPGAIVLAIAKWRAPLSLVRRNRWRFVAAILVGLTEVGLWIWGITYLLLRSKAGKI